MDVVVFQPGTQHKQENAYILVETKRAGTSPSNRTEGVDQLRSYMAACLNVKYGIWTNGDDQFCLAKRADRTGGFTFEEIIDVPGFGQTEADAQRPQRKDLKPATADNLLFAFRRCHNYIAGTEGKQKPEAFWELLKLIFLQDRGRALPAARLLRDGRRTLERDERGIRQGANPTCIRREGPDQVRGDLPIERRNYRSEADRRRLRG